MAIYSIDSEWTPANDCEHMTVPQMIVHIFKHRKSEAVAPNGHTTPYLTVEEWSRIAEYAKAEIARTDAAEK